MAEEESVDVEESADTNDQQVAEDEKTVESSTTEENDTPEGVDGEDTAAKPKAKGVQKRIDELVRQRSDVERDRDYWRDLAMKGQQQPEPEQPKAGIDIPPMPREYDFDTNEDYQKAVAERDAKLVEIAVGRIESQQSEQQRARTDSERRARFNESVEKLSETHPDAKAVIYGDGAVITASMANVLLNLDNGANVAYELGAKPELAYRISTLPPVEQAIELGRLSERANLPKPKTLSKAPEPVKTLGGVGEPAKVDPDKLSIDEWMEKRRAGEI